MELLGWATMAVALIVAVLAAALLDLYLRLYRRVRTRFTLGLATFAAFFLAEGIFLAYASWVMIPALEGPVAPFLLGIAVLESGGLGVQFAIART